MTGSKSNINLYGAELAKAIREDLKQAHIKGVTIRSKNREYTDCFVVTVTIEKSDIKTDYQVSERKIWNDLHNWGVWNGNKRVYANELYKDDGKVDMQKFEELRNEVTRRRLSEYSDKVQISHFCIEDYLEFTDAFREKLKTICGIISAYRYDNSNSMIDYFDTNFYYYIYTKAGKSWKGKGYDFRTQSDEN